MELIMVYNANSGLKNAVLDSFHKMISPSTYTCELCALTFGNFSEKTLWKKFRNQSKVKINFYHKDEFEAKFGIYSYSYPVSLWFKNQRFETAISNEAFKTIKSTEALIISLETHINNALKSEVTL